MHTLLLCLSGPMQSWGVQSRFSERDSLQEPSKSGVLGLLCAAMGIDRDDWNGLEPLTKLEMGVRVDREGVLAYDYQTSSGVLKAKDGKVDRSDNTVQSWRYYLADATFLVGLSGDNGELLETAWDALKNPIWPLSLGRKSYLPSRSIWLENGLKKHTPLIDALVEASWLLTDNSHHQLNPPETLQYVLEASSGAVRTDVPTDAFSKRQFGSRLVVSSHVPWGKKPEMEVR